MIGGAATETSPELVFSGVGVLATLMLLWALVIPGSDAHRRSSWRDLGTALGSRSLQTAMWLFLLPALCIGAIDVLVPLRLDDLGASGLTIGALFVAAAAIEALLNPVMGRRSDVRGRLPLIRIGLVGAGLTALTLPLRRRGVAAGGAAAGGRDLAVVLLGARRRDAVRRVRARWAWTRASPSGS